MKQKPYHGKVDTEVKPKVTQKTTVLSVDLFYFNDDKINQDNNGHAKVGLKYHVPTAFWKLCPGS